MEQLLTTKLFTPNSRSDLVARPRLIEQLNEGLRRRAAGSRPGTRIPRSPGSRDGTNGERRRRGCWLATFVLVLAVPGELALTMYLLWKGVNAEQWEKRALAFA